MHCKGEAQKSPLFWRFSGGFCFSQDRLFSRNSTRKPLNLIKSPIFTNAPCKTTCLYNAPSMHTVDFNQFWPMLADFLPILAKETPESFDKTKAGESTHTLEIYTILFEIIAFLIRKPFLGAKKKTNKQKTHKHFSDGPRGTIVPGRTPTRPRDKRDKMAILLWNSKKERPVCPRDGSHFVPGRGPICPRDGSCLSRTPSRRKCLCLLVFFLPEFLCNCNCIFRK